MIKYPNLKETIKAIFKETNNEDMTLQRIMAHYPKLSKRHAKRTIQNIIKEEPISPKFKQNKDIKIDKQLEKIIEQDLYVTESIIYKNGRLLSKTHKVINQYTFQTNNIETEIELAIVLGKILSILKTEQFIKVTNADKENTNIYKVIEDNCKFITVDKNKETTTVRFCSEAFNPSLEIEEINETVSELVEYFENELSQTHTIRRNWIDNLLPKVSMPIRGVH